MPLAPLNGQFRTREEMERKKAQYRLVSSHEGDTQKRQAPVHSSMKIEATTSRERNMELASKVGIHDSTVQSRPATSSEIARLGTSDKQASDQEHPAQSGTSELVGQKNTAESGADAPGDLETAAPASQEQDEANAAASPVKDVQYDEVAADRAFDATSFLQDLVESCVLRWYAPLLSLLAACSSRIAAFLTGLHEADGGYYVSV